MKLSHGTFCNCKELPKLKRSYLRPKRVEVDFLKYETIVKEIEIWECPTCRIMFTKEKGK